MSYRMKCKWVKPSLLVYCVWYMSVYSVGYYMLKDSEIGVYKIRESFSMLHLFIVVK